MHHTNKGNVEVGYVQLCSGTTSPVFLTADGAHLFLRGLTVHQGDIKIILNWRFLNNQ